MGLAFGLVIAAGLSTTIGSCFVFCSSYANTKALAAALGVSAGVMLYVSFVEIFAIKAVEGFSVQYPEHGSKYATLCFFCGIVFTMCLDTLVHQIGHWQLTRRTHEDGEEKNAESASRTHADPSNMLMGERARVERRRSGAGPARVKAPHPQGCRGGGRVRTEHAELHQQRRNNSASAER